MSPKVNYLSSAPAHLPYLVTSLHLLRKIWNGDVVCHAYPESYMFVEQIAKDSALNVECRLWKPDRRGKNGQFLQKIKLMQSLPGNGVNLYLDHDTLPVKVDALDHIIYLASQRGFCATQFCQWTTHGKIIAGRIRKMIDRPGIDQSAVRRALAIQYPSINGGVFACKADSPALPLWQKWTEAIIDVFIADEVALHAVMAKYDVSRQFTVATGGQYNCSPRHQPKELPDDQVGIWHGHGDSFLRPNKCPRAVHMWWPIYQKCLQENVGRIAEWKDDAMNAVVGRNKTVKYLKRLENLPDGVCVYCGGENEWDDSTDDRLIWHSNKCPLFKGVSDGIAV